MSASRPRSDENSREGSRRGALAWGALKNIAQARRAFRAVRSFDAGLGRTRLPGPGTIQVQTIDRCNASCVMCPYSDTAKPGPPRSMEPELYSSILEQSAHLGTLRTFIPMLQSEPLVDRRLADRYLEARRILGEGMRLPLVTNGSSLTPRRVDELLDAGVDNFQISIDAAREETYAKIRRGLSFRIVENVEALLLRSPRPEVVARFLRQKDNAGEEAEFTRFWTARGARVFLHAVVNRAGALDEFERLEAPTAPLRRRLVHAILNRLIPCCGHPFSSMAVLCDGRAIVCCHDWGHRILVGDLRTQTVSEIWNGEALNHVRASLRGGRSEDVSACAGCTHARGMWRAEARRDAGPS